MCVCVCVFGVGGGVCTDVSVVMVERSINKISCHILLTGHKILKLMHSQNFSVGKYILRFEFSCIYYTTKFSTLNFTLCV